MASVTYGKSIMASVIMAKVLWQMKLSPLVCLFVLPYARRSPPNPLQAAVPHEDLIPNLWEVAAWEIANLGSHLKVVHRGSHPWGNTFAKYL